MVDLKKLFKDYEDSRAFSSLINILGPVDNHAFQTKDGAQIVVIGMRGEDAECKEEQSLDSVANTCRSALSVFGERFIVNSFLLKRSNPALEPKHLRNPVAEEASKNRHALFVQKGTALYVYDAFLTITIKPEWKSPRTTDLIASFWRNPFETFKNALGTQTQIRALDANVTRSLRLLHQATNSFVEQTADCLHAQLLTKEEAFVFFRRLLNPDPAKATAVLLPKDSAVDFLAVDSELECYRDHLRLDNNYVKLLTLKQLPPVTFANIFSNLTKVKADLVVVTEWSALDPLKALADIRSKRRHAHNTKVGLFSQIGQERPIERETLYDESKEAEVTDLGESLKAIQMRGVRLGEFSLTVLILAPSIGEAERATAEVMKLIGSHDGALNEERYNGLNAFLAAVPGGYPYNLRKNIVTNENQADMVLWFQPAEGERTNPFLRGGYLAAFETEDRSLYFFNLHVQDVGHALVLGPTGSGKSFLLNFLITHAQQYEPYTFIFDVGGSYRWLTELLGGSYVPFRPELRSFSINPFCLEPTPGNLEFLFSFCKLLVESDGHQMTDAQDRDLFDAIRSLYVLEPEQRRLLTLSTTVSRAIGNHIRRWTEGEHYGQWFDNVKDNVTFSRCQCIDFEGMDRLGVVLEPLMFYLLHRANEIIYDESLGTVFKLAVVDEAWLFFKHPGTQAYITNAMRTWRKKNAAMILSTQSLEDLAGAHLFRPLVESCPTKLLLANPDLDAGFYAEALRLNTVEIEKVRRLVPKRQFLLKREGFAKVLNLDVDAKSYWLFTTNPYEAKRRQELVNQIGLEAALDILKGESR